MLFDDSVPMLEARFHPSKRSAGISVVVGRVRCEGDRATVESAFLPGSQILPFDTFALLEKLRFLVARSCPRPFQRLTALKSEYWSFVAVPNPKAKP